MIEKITRISNPLTIIAIFAALAEIASSVALITLPERTQVIFVWFCMLFPSMLVFIFFIVLYRKPKVLYAPSDFKDESNFISILDDKYLKLNQNIGHLSNQNIRGSLENDTKFVTQSYQTGASPKEIIEKARSEENPERITRLLSELLVNGDATSLELEIGGDIARRSGRRHLSLDLYAASTQKDPSRSSSQVELLAVKAELNVNERSKLISEMMKIALNDLSRNNFSRVANSLIEFDMYDELVEFSDAAIHAKPADIAIKSLALRNKGVALKEAGKPEKAIECFEQAISQGGEIENVLRPYLGLLKELGRNENILDVARKLVEIDATNNVYNRLLIDALLKNGMESEARTHMSKMQELGLSY